MGKKTTEKKTNLKVNWKTEVTPRSRNRELMIAKIRYGARKLNEQAKSIKNAGDLERNKVNQRLTKLGAIKHKGKPIDNFYNFTETNDLGDVKIKYSKKGLDKLTTGQLRKVLKGIEDLHADKSFSVSGMKKYFNTVRGKIWTTLSGRYKSKYSAELWAIIEKHKDTIVQRVMDASANGKVGKSDEILEEYVAELLQNKEIQSILQDTIERDQKIQREIMDRRDSYNRIKPTLEKRMYRNKNRR